MEKLSIDAAFRFHEMEWKELEERGCKKTELSIWTLNGGLIFGNEVKDQCFLCEYVKQQEEYGGVAGCAGCPAEVTDGLDCFSNRSVFQRWVHALDRKDIPETKRFAGIIRRWPRKIKEAEKIAEKVEVFHSRGQYFKHVYDRDKYILACPDSDSKVGLISLVNGNGWTGLLQVGNIFKITEAEFWKITNEQPGTFKLIEEQIYQTSV